MLKRSRSSSLSIPQTPSPVKKRREAARPSTEQLTDDDPLASLRPCNWVMGSVVSSALTALSNLWAESVMLLDCSAAELAGHEKRHARKLEMLLDSQPETGVVILLPAEVGGHWTVAVACIKEKVGAIRVFDSLDKCGRSEPHAAEAAALIQRIVDVATTKFPSHFPRVQALTPVATWPRSSARSTQQVGEDDCGVGVIMHVFHTLAGVTAPDSADWLLWRRAIAAFLQAQRKHQNNKLGMECTLDHIRKAHNELLSASTVAVQIQDGPLSDISKQLQKRKTSEGLDLKASQQLEEILGEFYRAVQGANSRAKREFQARQRDATATKESIRLILQALRAGALRSKIVLDLRAARDDKTVSIKCLQQSIDGIKRQGNDESTVRLLQDQLRSLTEERQSTAARHQAGEEARILSEGGLDAIEAELNLVAKSLG
ncbi:hypothetical protein LY78DRAFT_696202 [Colletotrichum sublineola]|nr:hypothetical protein LY78DRAFT_696202 [Colletotrichum sublineola]